MDDAHGDTHLHRCYITLEAESSRGAQFKTPRADTAQAEMLSNIPVELMVCPEVTYRKNTIARPTCMYSYDAQDPDPYPPPACIHYT